MATLTVFWMRTCGGARRNRFELLPVEEQSLNSPRLCRWVLSNCHSQRNIPLNDTQDRILEAGELRVHFTWQHDRFAHEISVLHEGSWQPALASVEGTPHDDWPPSPPFQSLHIEEREDGRTLALLVGMAGKSHWSASVEIDADSSSVVFDVACRLRAPATGQLGSTYQTLSATASLSTPLTIELTHRYGPARIQAEGGRNTVVAEPAGDDCPQTVRWDYRLRLAANA